MLEEIWEKERTISTLEGVCPHSYSIAPICGFSIQSKSNGILRPYPYDSSPNVFAQQQPTVSTVQQKPSPKLRGQERGRELPS